jgi:hypothetical protein
MATEKLAKKVLIVECLYMNEDGEREQTDEGKKQKYTQYM